MKNFISKLVGFSMGPIIGSFIALVTVPVTTFFISPGEFGKASMFTLVQTLMVSIIYLGIDQAYTKEFHYVKDKRLLFQNALITPLVFASSIAVLLIIMRKNFSQLLFEDTSYTNVSLFFGLMLIFSVIERFILLHIRMQEKALEYSLFTILLKSFILIFTIFIIGMGNRTFITVVYATIFGQIVGDISLIIKYRSLFDFRYFKLDSILVLQMIKFGIPLIVASFVTQFLNGSGRFFLRIYGSFHDLGVFAAALKVSSVIGIIQSSFTSFWVPVAYRWNKENRSIELYELVSDILLLLLTIGMFILILLKKPIILILSSEYSEAQYIIGLISLTPILYTLSETTTLGIVFSGKSFYNVYVTIISLIPNVLLNIFLIPGLGIIGAAISQGVSYLFFYYLRTYFSKRAGFKLNVRRQVLPVFLLFALALINSIPLKNILIGNIILMFVIIVLQKNTIRKIKNIIKGRIEYKL
ncbi:oligosaccharide flippase family protein [Enterococcus hirae]|uniref:lipopolysaccharide biosynthesis protein n=1 Tax=Enterococcus TaxID=1350 RepID=UPI0032E4267C